METNSFSCLVSPSAKTGDLGRVWATPGACSKMQGGVCWGKTVQNARSKRCVWRRWAVGKVVHDCTEDVGVGRQLQRTRRLARTKFSCHFQIVDYRSENSHWQRSRSRPELVRCSHCHFTHSASVEPERLRVKNMFVALTKQLLFPFGSSWIYKLISWSKWQMRNHCFWSNLVNRFSRGRWPTIGIW